MQKRRNLWSRLAQIAWFCPGAALIITGIVRINAGRKELPSIIIIVGGAAMTLAVLWDLLRQR